MVDFKAIETFMWVVTLGSFRGAVAGTSECSLVVALRC